MKIQSLSLENFTKYSKISVSFDDNVTYLIGKNGSGKSSLGLTGVQFMFQGIAEKVTKDVNHPLIGERFRFIGPGGVSGKGEMQLYDEKTGWNVTVQRKVTKTGTELKFIGPNTANLDQKWLTDLFNIFLISPKRFTELSSKDQAKALGIDTSEYDQAIAKLKTEFTEINRDIRSIGELTELEEIKPVDFADLSREKDEILAFNKLQEQRQEAIDNVKENIADLSKEGDEIVKEIERLKLRLKQISEEIKNQEKILSKFPEVEKHKPLDIIEEKIRTASDTNKKAVEYEKYLEKKTLKDKKTLELENNKVKQKQKEEDRINYIKSLKLPFDNLSIDEGGQLLMDGKPIKEPYFSTGELLKRIPILISSRNPELKYVFIQGFSELDDDNKVELEEYLTSLGFQLVIELVGKTPVKDKTSILLKENTVVESYKESKDKTLK